jgi:hypothetical protein
MSASSYEDYVRHFSLSEVYLIYMALDIINYLNGA